MPISFKHNNVKNFILISAADQISMQDALDAQKFFFERLALKPGYRLLVDARFAFSDNMSVDLISKMVMMEQQFPDILRGSKIAYIVSDEFLEKLASQYSITTQTNTIVFNSLSTALNFLGIDQPIMDESVPIEF